MNEGAPKNNKNNDKNNTSHAYVSKWRILVYLPLILILFTKIRPEPQLDWLAVEHMAEDYMKLTPKGNHMLQKSSQNYKNKHNSKNKFPSEKSIWNGHPLLGVIIVITGATSGIGKSLTKTVHGLGATVVAVGRSERKLHDLKVELEGSSSSSSSSSSKSRFIPILCDLSDLQSVSKAAQKIQTRTAHIDILVNNAGIHYSHADFGSTQSLQNKQGHDLAFGVNYLSHFLFTAKLLPHLELSHLDPRIVQVSSSYHNLADGTELVPTTTKPNDSDNNMVETPLASRSDKQSQTYVHKSRSYANSKLAQIYHMRGLHRRLRQSKSKIKVISICPAWVATNIGGDAMNNLELMGGFPSEGVGISSLLNALFLPQVGIETSEGEYNDYVGQVTWSFNIWPQGPQWLVQCINWLCLRDMFMHTIALVGILPFQKFAFQNEAVVRSSYESYDVDKQESLYTWSEKEIAQYL